MLLGERGEVIDEKEQMDTGNESSGDTYEGNISTPRNTELSVSSSFVRVERLFGVDNGYDVDSRERNPIISLSVNPGDPLLLATGGREGSVRLWKLEKQESLLDPKLKEEIPAVKVKQLTTLLGHSGQVNGVRFSSDGAYLATCSSDSTVRVYGDQQKKNNWKLAHSLRFHSLDVVDVTWISPTVLVSTSTDRNTVVWDALTGGRLQTLYSDKGSSCPKGVVSDPKGEYLIVMFEEGFMDVYRRNTGTDDGKYRLSRHVDLSKEDVGNFSKAFKSTLYARRGAWSPGGEFLLLPLGARRKEGACGVQYERLNLLEPVPGEKLEASKIFLGHSSRIVLVTVCPHQLVSEAEDESIFHISAMVSVDGVVSFWSSGRLNDEKPIAVIANVSSPMTVCTDATWSYSSSLGFIITLFLSFSDGSVTMFQLHNIATKKVIAKTTVSNSATVPSLNSQRVAGAATDVKSAQVELRVGGKRKIQPVFVSADDITSPSSFQDEIISVASNNNSESRVVAKIDHSKFVFSLSLNGTIILENITGIVTCMAHSDSLIVIGLFLPPRNYASILVRGMTGSLTSVLVSHPASLITVTSNNLIGIILGCSETLSIWKLVDGSLQAVSDDIPLVNFLKDEPIASIAFEAERTVVLVTESGKQATFNHALRKWTYPIY